MGQGAGGAEDGGQRTDGRGHRVIVAVMSGRFFNGCRKW